MILQALGDFDIDPTGTLKSFSHLQRRLKRDQPGIRIVPDPPAIDIEYLADERHAAFALQDFVDLLLILAHDHHGAAVHDNEVQLINGRIRIDADGDGAEGEGGELPDQLLLDIL